MGFLSLQNISIRFREQQVLESIDLEVRKGEILGLIGPNGAGKSSLIKILANLVFPDTGKLFLDEVEVPLTKFKDYCGFLIDAPAFYPYLNARENLEVFAKMNSNKRDLKKLFEQVGLQFNDKKKVKNFSTGMKQRLAIAQALLRNPDILILDEPFNGLDPNGFQDLGLLILELKKQGKTIIISSHLLNDLEEMADQFVLIHKGRIALKISKKVLSRGNKKVIFTFEKDISSETVTFFGSVNSHKLESRKIAVHLSPEEISNTIVELVRLGDVPINVQTSNVLQDKYLEITQ